jgi:WD40 repeat protein
MHCIAFQPDRSPCSPALASGLGFAAPLAALLLRNVTLREDLSLTGLAVASLACSPDGQWLALAAIEGGASTGEGGTVSLSLSADGPVLLLDAEQFRNRRELTRGAWPDHVRFSPGGKLVGAEVDGAVRAWRLKGKERWRRGRKVGDVAYSPDGSRVLLSDEGGRYTLVDVTSGQKRELLAGASPRFLRPAPTARRPLAWSGDGRRFASASFDGKVKLWEVGG